MQRCVIVGANGYLGWNFAEYMLYKGYEVYAFVQKGCSYKQFSNIENLHIKEYLLENLHEMEIHELQNVELLINFSWAGVGSLHKNDYEIQLKNLTYVHNILAFIEKHHIHKYIAMGSASECVYGNLPITSASIPYPCDAYSAYKVAAKYISEVYCQQHQIDFNWIRLSSVYGPGRRDGNIIDYTIESILNHDKTQYTPLKQMWDYIFIEDVVRGIEAICKYGKTYVAYPLGFGKSYPLYHYINIIYELMNTKQTPGVGILDYKLGSPDDCFIDMEETFKDTGFSCQTSFEKGIQAVIEDYIRGGKI